MPGREGDETQNMLKGSGLCQHGNFPSSCEACAKEAKKDNPIRKMIEFLAARSKFKRSTLESPDCNLEKEGAQYQIEMIKSGGDPQLSEVQNMLVDEFGEEEVDPEPVLRSIVDGKSIFSKEPVSYRVYAAKDSNGEMASVLAGANLNLKKDGKPTCDVAYNLSFVVTKDKFRNAGLANELLISSAIQSVNEADNQGKKLSLAFGEATDESEIFWNKIEGRRVYAADKPGSKDSYTEIRFVYPPLEFDTQTGEVAEGASESYDYMMLANLSETPITKEKIFQIIDASYDWCTWPKEIFTNDEAYQKHLSIMEGFRSKFKKDLDSRGELTFLTKKEKAEKESQGVKINQ